MAADPIALNEAANCFACLNTSQLLMVKVYLLALIAGGSTDPQVLLTQSLCFECLSPYQLKKVEVLLLDRIANP